MTYLRPLTKDELHALDLTAQLANAFGRIVGDGRTRQADLHEAVQHIHALQHAIMSQAAARAYPERFRLLGGVIEILTDSDPSGPDAAASQSG